MTLDDREVLSALIDGEAVDPDTLERVLADTDSRSLLVEFVRLRNAITRDDEAASAVRYTDAQFRMRYSRRRSVLWIAAGILLLLVSSGGGWWLGARFAQDGPPAPARVVEFQPGVDWR